MKIAAIIVAAGTGNRMQRGNNKLLLEICGQTVIERTLNVFSACAAIDDIILVTSDSDILKIAGKFPRVTKTVDGGSTRTESVLNGLLSAGEADYVAIHDGARPLITEEIILSVISAAKTFGAAITGTDVLDTIKRTDDSGVIVDTPLRSSLKFVQTPQVFRRDLLLSAYNSYRGDATDDAFLLESAGIPVKVIAGSRENIKITTEFDLLLAEAIILAREKI